MGKLKAQMQQVESKPGIHLSHPNLADHPPDQWSANFGLSQEKGPNPSPGGGAQMQYYPTIGFDMHLGGE